MKSAHSRALEAKIRERVEQLKEWMATGQAPDFHRTIGNVQGLREALELSADVDLELSGELRPDARS